MQKGVKKNHMKQVRINLGKVGLVFKNGDYNKVITEGVYWIGFLKNVIVYDLTQEFQSFVALEILLKDEKLAEMLTVVEVKDNELVLVFENGNFKEVKTAGRYVYWKGLIERDFVKVDLNKADISEKIETSLFSKYELTKFIRVFEVEAYEKAIILVNDTYKKTVGGGVYRFWKNNETIKISKVDTRQLQMEISGQELLTKDKATIRVNFDMQYKMIDVEKALLENKDYQKQLYVIMQLAIRVFIGNFTLDELLERKGTIAEAVFDEVKTTVGKLGVKVLNCGIRDVILTGEMKEIMNQVLVAQKRAQANIITRREETASTRNLLNTAKLMEDNEMLFKLKEMEYVEKIADKVGEISVSGNGNMVKQLKEIFSGSN